MFLGLEVVDLDDDEDEQDIKQENGFGEESEEGEAAEKDVETVEDEMEHQPELMNDTGETVNGIETITVAENRIGHPENTQSDEDAVRNNEEIEKDSEQIESNAINEGTSSVVEKIANGDFSEQADREKADCEQGLATNRPVQSTAEPIVPSVNPSISSHPNSPAEAVVEVATDKETDSTEKVDLSSEARIDCDQDTAVGNKSAADIDLEDFDIDKNDDVDLEHLDDELSELLDPDQQLNNNEEVDSSDKTSKPASSDETEVEYEEEEVELDSDDVIAVPENVAIFKGNSFALEDEQDLWRELLKLYTALYRLGTKHVVLQEINNVFGRNYEAIVNRYNQVIRKFSQAYNTLLLPSVTSPPNECGTDSSVNEYLDKFGKSFRLAHRMIDNWMASPDGEDVGKCLSNMFEIIGKSYVCSTFRDTLSKLSSKCATGASGKKYAMKFDNRVCLFEVQAPHLIIGDSFLSHYTAGDNRNQSKSVLSPSSVSTIFCCMEATFADLAVEVGSNKDLTCRKRPYETVVVMAGGGNVVKTFNSNLLLSLVSPPRSKSEESSADDGEEVAPRVTRLSRQQPAFNKDPLWKDLVNLYQAIKSVLSPKYIIVQLLNPAASKYQIVASQLNQIISKVASTYNMILLPAYTAALQDSVMDGGVMYSRYCLDNFSKKCNSIHNFVEQFSGSKDNKPVKKLTQALKSSNLSVCVETSEEGMYPPAKTRSNEGASGKKYFLYKNSGQTLVLGDSSIRFCYKPRDAKLSDSQSDVFCSFGGKFSDLVTEVTSNNMLKRRRKPYVTVIVLAGFADVLDRYNNT